MILDECSTVTQCRNVVCMAGENPIVPAMHGGVVGGFMGQCASQFLIALINQPLVPKIINFSLDYLRACRLRYTYARCVVTRQGLHVAKVAISTWQENENTPCTLGRALSDSRVEIIPASS